MPFFCNYLLSIFIGVGVGLVYGFCFYNKNTFSLLLPTSTHSKLYFFLIFLFACLRFIFLGLFFAYVLHAPSLNIILVVTSFLVGFWMTILAKRA